MNPSCPTSNNYIGINEPYEYVEDIYYCIKNSGINIFVNKNNKQELLGHTDGYQTRPTYQVSGGVFVIENDRHYLVRGSAYKINDKNYILDEYSIE